MRTLAKGENASLSRSIDASKLTVTTTHTVKEDRDTDVRTELTWTFDFSKCSQEQILELAERSIRIRKQADWRKDKDKNDAAKWDRVTFDVAAELAERRTADPMQRAAKALEGLSPAQVAELLARFNQE